MLSRITIFRHLRAHNCFRIPFEDDLGADTGDEMRFRRCLDLVPEFPVLKESHWHFMVPSGHSVPFHHVHGWTHAGT